jgi:hypothetical protein
MLLREEEVRRIVVHLQGPSVLVGKLMDGSDLPLMEAQHRGMQWQRGIKTTHAAAGAPG